MFSIAIQWARRLAGLRPAVIDSERTLGERGELAAERLLKKKGYRILERGLRTGLGELDLIALDRRTIVFVEVKTRACEDPRDPFEAVNLKKQRKITKLALAYLKKHNLLEQSARFDIIGINWPTGSEPVIHHFEHAFEAADHNALL